MTASEPEDRPVPYTLTPQAEAALAGPEPEAGLDAAASAYDAFLAARAEARAEARAVLEACGSAGRGTPAGARALELHRAAEAAYGRYLDAWAAGHPLPEPAPGSQPGPEPEASDLGRFAGPVRPGYLR